MSSPPPLDRIVVPKTTMLGLIMRISARMHRCGNRAIIEADPYTILEMQKAVAEELNAPHDIFSVGPDARVRDRTIFMLDGVEFRVRKPPNAGQRSPIPPSGACC